MTENEFRRMAIKAVVDYTNKHIDKTDDKEITAEDVYVVWQVKVLQNNKALLSTRLSDGMYYECTYNGDKDEMYVDCYKKRENFCVVGNLENAIIRRENELVKKKINMLLPPFKFYHGQTVKVIDETQIFPSSRYLIEHRLFPYYTEEVFERLDSDYLNICNHDLLTSLATVCAVDYDNSNERYVYIVQVDDMFFAFYEQGLASLSEGNPQ